MKFFLWVYMQLWAARVLIDSFFFSSDPCHNTTAD